VRYQHGSASVAEQLASEQEQVQQVADCFFELMAKIISAAEQLAQQISVPMPFIKALHSLDGPCAMKELGRRMHCDPSFVTLIADMLEKRGLARREPHPADRRVKNLVLTDDGVALKHTIESEIIERMPWSRLDGDERAQLLALIRKMLGTDTDGVPATGTVTPDVLHGKLASLLVAALHDSEPGDTAPGDAAADGVAAPQTSAQREQPPLEQHGSPPPATGEVTRAVGESPATR
jgi:MarR family transcriptional regulator, organic hydroperoxide resistance regulator